MAHQSPYLKAALLTLAIALIGFFFISQLDSLRVNELRNSVNALSYQSESERFLFTYSQVMGGGANELCGYVSKTTQIKEDKAYALSEKIRYYEQSNIVNAEYETIKDEYYLSNAALYLNMRSTAKYCGSSPYTTILFFYRVKQDCPECRAQGGVLDNLRKKYPNMRVFAFPNDTDHEFINVFLRRHNVTAVPSLVIDDSTVLQGLTDEGKLSAYLARQS